MLSFETRIEITTTTEEVVNFNNYLYKVCVGTIGDVSNIMIYVPEQRNIAEGDCLNVSKASLTSYDIEEGKKKTVAVRVDNFEIVPKEEFEPLSMFTARCNGLVVKSDKAVIENTGPEGTPFFKCTFIYRNERRKEVRVLLVGRNKGALLLDKIESGRYIDATVRIRTHRKPGNYRFSISEYNYVERKEV